MSTQGNYWTPTASRAIPSDSQSCVGDHLHMVTHTALASKFSSLFLIMFVGAVQNFT